MARYMNLLTDYGFKRIFGSEDNKKILINFLNVILKGEENIIDLSFKDKEILPSREDGKRILYDLYCETSDHRHIIVEMQRFIQPFFLNRALFYTSASLVSQGIKGGKWQYSVEPVYGIFLLDFHLPELPEKMIREAMLQDKETHEVISDKLKLIFIDLQAMDRSSIDDCITEQENWIYSIKNMEDMENKPKGYPMLEDLFNASEICNLTAEEAVCYSESRQRLKDEEYAREWYGKEQLEKGIAQGLEEGIAKGMEKGFKAGLVKVAAAMKKHGEDISRIHDLTGLPVSEIEKL